MLWRWVYLSNPNALPPQYIIINLGISMGFGGRVDFAHLVFPTTLRVDYVRVYQDPKNVKTSCDPPDAPTAAYIEACVRPW